MGRNKMLLEVDGEPIVRRTVRRALESGLAWVVVVLGHEAAQVRQALAGLACTFVENPDFTGPTSGSLHAALRALDQDTDAVVIMLADMVYISTEMLQAVQETAESSAAPLVVSRYGDVNAPPLLFRRALWPELLAWHGEGCGKAVVQAHRAEAELLDWPVEALRDIDTPADYEELTR
jgi:molybdenum cofactor cytidylyltransferase